MTTLRSWLRKLFVRQPRSLRRATTWGGLTVEALEDRTVPSAARLPALQQPPPALMSVTALSNTEVQLDFNRRLGQGHALTSTYAIPGLSVLSATPSNQRRTVTLTTSSQDDSVYDVTLANLRTRGGKRITVSANAGTFQGIGLPDTILPRVAGAVSTGNTTILVSFSEALADSALNPAHYSVTQTNVNPEAGTVRVLDVRFLDASRTAVELETSPQNELTYIVKAVNVTDLAGNALAPAVFFGGERIDPSQANFAGTPPSGAEIVDTDGDGLSDNDELRGWTVVVKQVNGTLLSRQVMSDPLSVDTDGEGFTDAVEAQLRLDPRDADTDDDLLTDFQEYTEIFCDHLNQDSDGDGVDDGTEFLGVFSSPTHADTDGDQIPDGEEIPNPNRNPLVADLPTPAIEIGNINLQLDVRFTETTSTGTRELETKSVTSSLTQSDNKTFSNENSNTQEAMAKLSVGTEFTVDTGLLGLLADGLEFKTNVGVETSYTGSWTTTNTTTSARATERAYQDSLTTDAETTAGATVEHSVLGARMQVTVFLRNPSTMSFNARNPQLTAFIFDPSDPTRLTPVATLLPTAGTSLTPLRVPRTACVAP